MRRQSTNYRHFWNMEYMSTSIMWLSLHWILYIIWNEVRTNDLKRLWPLAAKITDIHTYLSVFWHPICHLMAATTVPIMKYFTGIVNCWAYSNYYTDNFTFLVRLAWSTIPTVILYKWATSKNNSKQWQRVKLQFKLNPTRCGHSRYPRQSVIFFTYAIL